MAALAYYILARCLIAEHDANSKLVTAIGNDFKGKISLVIYASAVPLAFVNSWISMALYIVVALMWFVPDRRIEKNLNQ